MASQNIIDPPKELSDSILKAITGALMEEKVPKRKRYFKVLFATLFTSLVMGLTLFFTFGATLNWIVAGAFIFWAFCLLVGFTLYFHPQPRLIVPGLFSPLVFARLILVSTLALAAQILICPSFVYLESPLPWNPLEGITRALMDQGGMLLCMSFCGFFFSFVSGLVGVGSIHKVLKGRLIYRLPKIAAVLFVTQIPLIWVQAMTPSLVEFLPPFIGGSVLGILVSFFLNFAIEMLRSHRSSIV